MPQTSAGAQPLRLVRAQKLIASPWPVVAAAEPGTARTSAELAAGPQAAQATRMLAGCLTTVRAAAAGPQELLAVVEQGPLLPPGQGVPDPAVLGELAAAQWLVCALPVVVVAASSVVVAAVAASSPTAAAEGALRWSL